MGKMRMALGVEIPNHDCRLKTSGGDVGAPDGFSIAADTVAEITAGQVAVRWPIMGDGPSGHQMPPLPYGSGRYVTMEQTVVGLTATHVREIYWPPTVTGHFMGAEQMNKDGGGYWYYRLHAAVGGRVITAGTGLNAGTVCIDIYSANGNRHRRSCYISIPQSSLDGTWDFLSSPLDVCDVNGWTNGPGGTDPIYGLVTLGIAGGTNSSAIMVAVADVVLETLGPVDQGTQAGTLHASPAPNTYYELSKEYNFDGLKPATAISLARKTVLPSGAQRLYDASGGMRPFTMEYPHRLLTSDDARKVWRLWNANRGLPGNSGTLRGKPLPLVVTPMDPRYAQSIGFGNYRYQSFYADFDNDTFPLDAYDGGYFPADDTGTRYKGTLKFRSR